MSKTYLPALKSPIGEYGNALFSIDIKNETPIPCMCELCYRNIESLTRTIFDDDFSHIPPLTLLNYVWFYLHLFQIRKIPHTDKDIQYDYASEELIHFLFREKPICALSIQELYTIVREFMLINEKRLNIRKKLTNEIDTTTI
jgi:hypothetical protein